jgi:uncharacterized protein (TIGR02466 family)
LDNTTDIYCLFPKVVAKTSLSLTIEEKNNLNVIYDNKTFIPSKGVNSPDMSQDLYVLNDVTWLADKFNTVAKNFTENYLKWEKTKLKLSTSWFTKTKLGQESSLHTHANHILSGVFYWNNTDNCKITFENLNPGHHWEILPNNNSNTFTLGDCELIIFPSELHHKIEPWTGKEDRKSLAFNWIPSGEIGSFDSKVSI